MPKLYHYSRLLDQEIENIKKHGLKILSLDLIKEKYNLLMEYSDKRIVQDTSKLEDWLEGRKDQICFMPLSFQALQKSDPDAVADLVTNWGGELMKDNYSDTFEEAYSEITKLSHPYEISVDVSKDTFLIYENFTNKLNHVTEIKNDYGYEYQIKENISPEYISITKLKNT